MKKVNEAGRPQKIHAWPTELRWVTKMLPIPKERKKVQKRSKITYRCLVFCHLFFILAEHTIRIGWRKFKLLQIECYKSNLFEAGILAVRSEVTQIRADQRCSKRKDTCSRGLKKSAIHFSLKWRIDMRIRPNQSGNFNIYKHWISHSAWCDKQNMLDF